jgi:hypothetical protein
MPLFNAKTRLPSQKWLNRSSGVRRGSAAPPESLSLHFVQLQCRYNSNAGAGSAPFFVIHRITPYLLVLPPAACMHKVYREKMRLAPKVRVDQRGTIKSYSQLISDSKFSLEINADVGHCLHDDKPELVHAELVPWLEKLHASE